MTAPAADRPRRSATRPSSRRSAVTPVLVRQLRNGIEESVHRGDIVEADASGALIRVLGDPDRVVTLRSTVKPFGALALIEAGGIKAFDLQPAEIAILASSHSGEDLHVRTLQGIFRRAPCQPGAPGLRVGGDAARRAHRGASGPRRREGRADPPHVLRPALGLAPALEAQRLGSDRLLATDAPLAGRLPGGRRQGVRDDAGQAEDRHRRLRGRDLRLPIARGRPGLCLPGGSGRGPHQGLA